MKFINSPVHISYGLNVHPGETWEKILEAIRVYSLKVKQRVIPENSFGLGLRLSYLAADQLSEAKTLCSFQQFLQEQNLYVFTINGFPYGEFHETPVKDKVYQPDWRSTKRRDYTLLLADILSELLPEDMEGSISTVPISFNKDLNASEEEACIQHLMEVVLHLKTLEENKGKYIHLGLEPEPCCYLETTNDFLRFFKDKIIPLGSTRICQKLHCGISRAESLIQRYLGICFDVCHMSIQFENPTVSLNNLLEQGIKLSKIQLSSALRLDASKNLNSLEAFKDEVYLHQVKAMMESGELLSWDDLPFALSNLNRLKGWREIRVHYHVPLYWEGNQQVCPTAPCMNTAFFNWLKLGKCPHLEIETYTYDVFPEMLKKRSLVESIAQEFEWVFSRC